MKVMICRKPTLVAVLVNLTSLCIWAGLALGANFGIHPVLSVLGLIWLFTIGLPTTVGVILAAFVWGRTEWTTGLTAFALLAAALGCLFQILTMGVLWRRATLAQARGRGWSRSQVMVWLVALGLLLVLVLQVTYRPMAMPSAAIDGHAHLFGHRGWPPTHNRTSGLSPKQKSNLSYGILTRLLGLSSSVDLDEPYVQALVRQAQEARRVVPQFRVVLLAQDCRYTEAGEPDWVQSTVYVPNAYLFEVVRRYPELFLPCPSINPRRKDWEAELDFCIREGARVLKIHPPTQEVDPSDGRFRTFYRRCAERGVAVMVHTGSEHSAPIADPSLGDPRLLELALAEGCTVIAAHAGTKAFFDPPAEDHITELTKMMERYPRLLADTAVLGSQFRWRCIPTLLASPPFASRVVHASDWPFPSNALAFWNRLHPFTLVALMAERNLFLRDLRLKGALGLPLASFMRMGGVLEARRGEGEQRLDFTREALAVPLER